MAYTDVPSSKNQILDKIARDAEFLGLTVSRSLQANGANAVVVDNASNDLTISYKLTAADGSAIIAAPMGGVDSSSSPYLGIGLSAPGALTITSSITTNDNMSDIIDSAIAAQVLQLVSGYANNIVLSNSDAAFTATLRGGIPGVGSLGQ